MKLREKILDVIRRIEAEFDVKVCYAVESGSRALGFSSEDSDYDVRFIYVNRKDWYLSLDEKRDVIELPINDTLDINGWDIRKALKLFRKSNPLLMEWLHSEIVYYKAFSLIDKMRTLENKVFAPKPALHHYVQMAKRNYRDYHNRDKVKIKQYFYILRPILACKWIEKYSSIPPVEFKELMEEIISDRLLKKEMLKLLNKKIQGSDNYFEPKNSSLNGYIESELSSIDRYIESLKDTKKENSTLLLDSLFRETLEEVWS